MRIRGNAWRSACGIVTLAEAMACGNPRGDAENVPLAQTLVDSAGAPTAAPATLSAAAQAALDSGNALYRRADYAGALALYRRSAKESPVPAAPYFGIYMAALKLKNRALADSALRAMGDRNVSPSPAHADTTVGGARSAAKVPAP